MSVSLEIVVRLFFRLNCIFEPPAASLYNGRKKDGGNYERKTKSFVPEQPAEDNPLT